MAKAGCEGVNFGIESSDVASKRQWQAPDLARAVRELHSNLPAAGYQDIRFFHHRIAGDTVHTILQTIGFAVALKPDWVQFTAASPFIGTKLRAWAVSNGLAAEDEYAYVNSHEVWMGNDHLSKTQVKALYHFARFFRPTC